MPTQKISWDNYAAELELMCIKTRGIKRNLLVLARKAQKWNMALGYISKILLILTGAGGGIQIFSQMDNDFWLTVLRTVLEIIIGITVTTKDAFNFEKQTEKYYSAEKSINAFYEILKFQSFQIKGTEGDRFEVLKGLKSMQAEILAANQIIQTVEAISSPTTPDDIGPVIEIGDDDSASSQHTAVSGPDHPEDVKRRESKVPAVPRALSEVEGRTRMFYLHKMLDDLHN